MSIFKRPSTYFAMGLFLIAFSEGDVIVSLLRAWFAVLAIRVVVDMRYELEKTAPGTKEIKP